MNMKTIPSLGQCRRNLSPDRPQNILTYTQPKDICTSAMVPYFPGWSPRAQSGQAGRRCGITMRWPCGSGSDGVGRAVQDSKSEKARLGHRHMCGVGGTLGIQTPGPYPILSESHHHPLALAVPWRPPSPLQEGV